MRERQLALFFAAAPAAAGVIESPHAARPLILRRGRSLEFLRDASNAIHEALVATANVPPMTGSTSSKNRGDDRVVRCDAAALASLPANGFAPRGRILDPVSRELVARQLMNHVRRQSRCGGSYVYRS